MDKYNSRLARLLRPKGVYGFAITISKRTTLYSTPKDVISDRWRKHEDEHKAQIAKDGSLKFFTKYLAEYMLGRLLLQSHCEAYRNISYEVKAREAERSDILAQF